MAALAEIERQYDYILQERAPKLLEEVAVSPDDVRTRNIRAAILWFSNTIPQLKTVLVAPTSDGYHPVPADWSDRSRLVSIEFPLDQNPPAFIDLRRNVRTHRRETGKFFYIQVPPTGNFRLTYTTKHDSAAASIDPDHERVVALYAAAVAAGEYAARYANSTQNNLDAVNYRSKEQEWRAVEKDLREQAEREIRLAAWRHAHDADDAGLSRTWRV